MQNLVIYFEFKQNPVKTPSEDKRAKSSAITRDERRFFSGALFYLIKHRFDLTQLMAIEEFTDHFAAKLIQACQVPPFRFLSYSYLKKLASDSEKSGNSSISYPKEIVKSSTAFIVSLNGLSSICDVPEQKTGSIIHKLEVQLSNLRRCARVVKFDIDILVNDKKQNMSPHIYHLGVSQDRSSRAELNAILNKELKLGNFLHRILGLSAKRTFAALKFLLTEQARENDAINYRLENLLRFGSSFTDAIDGSDHKSTNHCQKVMRSTLTVLLFDKSRFLKLIHASKPSSIFISGHNLIYTATAEIPEKIEFKDLKDIVNFKNVSIFRERSKYVRLSKSAEGFPSHLLRLKRNLDFAKEQLIFKFEECRINQSDVELIFSQFVVVDISSVKSKLGIGYATEKLIADTGSEKTNLNTEHIEHTSSSELDLLRDTVSGHVGS